MAVLASRNWSGGYRCRFGGSLVPLAPLPLTTARIGAGTLVVFGDYQIAPIAARSTAMGRWRLMPPGYGGRRLRAQAGAFRAPARVTFFFCKKKVTKENHSNLRFKDPLARGGQVQIWRCVLAGGVQRSSLSVKRTVPAFTGAEAGAAACFSHGRGICFYRVGDYQIAPIAARSTAMGRCALRARGVICLLSRNTREQKSLP